MKGLQGDDRRILAAAWPSVEGVETMWRRTTTAAVKFCIGTQCQEGDQAEDVAASSTAVEIGNTHREGIHEVVQHTLWQFIRTEQE